MKRSAGFQIIEDVKRAGSCCAELWQRHEHHFLPSCSRVENESLSSSRGSEEMTTAKDRHVAVMGCRVNGPGETTMRTSGYGVAQATVNLKRRA